MFTLGLALLALAYHVAVYALDVADFRAPMPLVVVVSSVVVIVSLLLDRVENRRDRSAGA